MTRYRVFEPSGAEAPSEAALFVRDRFGWVAFLVPLVWLLRYRLFPAALAVLASSLALIVGLRETAAGWTVPLLSLLVGLVVALEGPSWRARRLERRGWRETAVVTATCLGDAEAIYFAGKAVEAESAAPAMSLRETAHGTRLRPGRTLFDLAGA